VAEGLPDLTELHDEYPIELDRVHDDVPMAQRAVIIHQAEHWPTGLFCRNCHDRWACRLYRWGQRVLVAAGWSEQDIADLVVRASAGELPPFTTRVR